MGALSMKRKERLSMMKKVKHRVEDAVNETPHDFALRPDELDLLLLLEQ
jgi:hypothetical protein